MLSFSSKLLKRSLLGVNTSYKLNALRAAAGTGHGFATEPHPADSFLNGTNSVYMEEMYRLWQQDPSKVHASWNVYFTNVQNGLGPGQAFIAPPQLQPGVKPTPRTAGSGAGLSGGQTDDKSRTMHLVRAFQVRGHELAKLDPLGLQPAKEIPELDPATYGFTEADMDRPMDLTGFTGVKGFMALDDRGTLRELLNKLKEVYCNRIGFEYMHITSREQCNWIRERIELSDAPKFSAEKKEQVYDRLAWADKFERFVAVKYGTAKRFGLEGCETMIPGIKAMVDRFTELGVEHAVFGMPHRGRLNMLGNVIRKPLESIFKEFQGTHVDIAAYGQATGDWSGSGDVKYHLGTSFDRTYADGRKVHLALVANPSHLEAVNPVVCGKVKAKQDNLPGETDPEKKAVAVLIHGDAAFAGQGIVYETMQMSQVRGFGTGGTVHVVCNNQIGFTTDPSRSRSTRYCSDIGKCFEAPVFHVNADDPEAVVRAFELAAEWRQKWRSDVIIDLIGYRKHGHNELDEPGFTQPLMYDRIKNHPEVLQSYKQFLINEGIVKQDRLDAIDAEVVASLEKAYNGMDSHEYKEEWLSSHWKGFNSPSQLSRIQQTGVDKDVLQQIAEALIDLPEGFKPHTAFNRVLKNKAKMVKSGEGIDWGTAEALAFGSLMRDGNRVRLSGQDVERGTFSHRHAVITDVKTNEAYSPLARFGSEDTEDFRAPLLSVNNSILSEFGVMGFELGYNLEHPDQLTLWEGQFGDFANGAQVMIDQFLTSGEQKWKRQCGLTLLLPHGYEGQGPEHSSCRLERYLQASDEDESVVPRMDEERTQIQMTNLQVVYCSTPANYFHVLRRQVNRSFRKPLVVVTPKSLLRLAACVSTLDDMASGTRFQRFIPDSGADIVSDPAKVRRVVLCTGKVYYDLLAARKEAGIDDVVLSRVEQLAPFPFDHVAKEAAKYGNAEIVWAQEEPRNMGAWSFVAPRIRTATRELNGAEVDVRYVGRKAAASPAVGVLGIHNQEQNNIVSTALE